MAYTIIFSSAFHPLLNLFCHLVLVCTVGGASRWGISLLVILIIVVVPLHRLTAAAVIGKWSCSQLGVAIYFAIVFVVALVMYAVDMATGMGSQSQSFQFGGRTYTSEGYQASLLSNLVINIISMFLSLGATRIVLNMVDGKEYNIGMLFGGGPYFLKALGAFIFIFIFAVVFFAILITMAAFIPGLGLLLLLIGIGFWVYLSLRYGYYFFAIVDKGMGPMEALQYSSRITTGQRLNLFLLMIVMFVVTLLGLLAFLVGIIFTGAVAMMSWVVAYRWLQHGRRVTE